jgi:hypothetical protein
MVSETWLGWSSSKCCQEQTKGKTFRQSGFEPDGFTTFQLAYGDFGMVDIFLDHLVVHSDRTGTGKTDAYSGIVLLGITSGR